MKYTINKLDDYNKALKFGGKQLLCYSPEQFKRLGDSARIIGEANDRKNDDKDKAENTLSVSGKVFTVSPVGDTNRLLCACRGYVSVGENEYIALYKSRMPFIFWLLGILGVAAVALVLILTLGRQKPQEVFHPLPPVDSSAESIPGDGDRTEDVEDGGGKVDMNYSPVANLSLSTGQISINFVNPGESSHDVVVELYVVSGEGASLREYMIAQSGRVPAGSRLSSMSFSADASIFSGEGSYTARYRLMYYDSDTGEKALVDSILDNITLKVSN